MRLEWSRHYDTLVWHVITMSTAGIGTLLGISFSDRTPKWWPELGGLGLMVLGVFYVASFRSFRANLHSGLKDAKLLSFVKNPSPKKYLGQWEIFVFSFFVVGELFVYKLATKTSCFGIVLGVGLIIVPSVLFVSLKRSRPTNPIR